MPVYMGLAIKSNFMLFRASSILSLLIYFVIGPKALYVSRYIDKQVDQDAVYANLNLCEESWACFSTDVRAGQTALFYVLHRELTFKLLYNFYFKEKSSSSLWFVRQWRHFKTNPLFLIKEGILHSASALDPRCVLFNIIQSLFHKITKTFGKFRDTNDRMAMWPERFLCRCCILSLCLN